jgi:hypothetical protein
LYNSSVATNSPIADGDNKTDHTRAQDSDIEENEIPRRANTAPATLGVPLIGANPEDEADRRKQSMRRNIPVGAQIKAVFCSSWMTLVLLPCVPIGLTIYNIFSHTISVALLNFAAIFPSTIAISIALKNLNIRAGIKNNALLSRNVEWEYPCRNVLWMKLTLI